MKHIETNIPFPGFYCSIYDSEFDSVIEADSEYFAGEWNADPVAVANAAFRHFDGSDARLEIAKLHVSNWLERFTDETGIDVYTGHAFKLMTSPKWYNFDTDRVFCDIPLAAVTECFKRHKADKFATLAQVIRARFTSHDGFISHYSNDIETWLEKPMSEWDCNEIATLLIATVGLLSRDTQEEFNRAVEYETLEYGTGNGMFDAVDWDAVKRDVAE